MTPGCGPRIAVSSGRPEDPRRGGRPARFLPAAVLVSLLAAGFGGTAAARTPLELPLAFGRFPDGLYALRAPNLYAHNVGLLSLQVTNVGIFGNPFIDAFSAGWQGGEYLHVGGLWVGAIGADGEAHVSTGTTFEFRPELDARWTVYESYEGAPHGTRLLPDEPRAADDDGDGLIDEDFQNGFDDDGDGLIDEDYSAAGHQMFSCQYRDDTPEALRQISDHVPLGLLVHQRSFEWAVDGLNEFVGLEFEIINIGDQELKNAYLGFYNDSDAGPKDHPRYWLDDYTAWSHIDTVAALPGDAGACSQRRVSVDAVYTWDAPDNGVTISGGDVPGVFGLALFGYPTDYLQTRAPQNVGFRSVAIIGASDDVLDPQTDDERYALMAGGRKPGPGAQRPDDYHAIVASGPFRSLNPGESLTLDMAYVVGNGQAGFRHNVAVADRVFGGRWVDLDGDPSTGSGGAEYCLRVIPPAKVVEFYPPCTDSLGSIPPMTKTRYKLTTCLYLDVDCDVCTGTGGAETPNPWVGSSAPPPPTVNTATGLDPLHDPRLRAFVPPAGDRRVVIQWDNGSEVAENPTGGKIVFDGYRLWRVDNWQRPFGSLGPSPGEWIKLAEFRVGRSQTPPAGTFPLVDAVRTDVPSLGSTADGKPIYPVGRYQYSDTLGITNGKLYFYAVTAIGVLLQPNPVSGVLEEVEITGRPSAAEAEAVVPRWAAAEGCDRVRVVPNPYRGGADWDLIPSEGDPTGTKIAFRNLPRAWSVIRIYTLAGDLVQRAEHDGAGGDGTWFWNLVSRNGQNVSSGLYLYSVESPSGICRGRFAIIR